MTDPRSTSDPGSIPSGETGRGPDSPEIARQAAEWVIRRQGEAHSAQDERAWERWRSADPAHVAAYARAERLWAELGGLKEAPDLVPETAPAVAPAVVPGVARVATPRGAVPRRRTGIARHVWGGGGLAALAAIAVFAATGGEPMLALRADQRTAIGETRDIALPDGSRARLMADSAIAVHYSAGERRVELLKGEAIFDARPIGASGTQAGVSTAAIAAATATATATPAEAAGGSGAESRPFVVTAATGAIRALGTRFLVERLATHTRVVGIEHRVAVSIAVAPNAPTTVSEGQVLRYDATAVGAVETASPTLLDAEARGQLVFEHLRLDDVVARLNRHYPGHIAVRGEALARREVSGVFPAADVDGVIAALRDELGLRVLRLPGVVILY
ncbi:FecR domain-containing protein [Mitsuaria sp. GD03876]|uniref:FecR family protein n=1 Tax=Mitsuaria sp. GD03876 TaxID=2975399 RepID=UPI002448D0EC|nr:FecR domain-containing protein [Mitsuaria sp. GD03876]MDH0865037.1 FecR domain-containing protein [Mitsuaria sp. GD03876]